MNARTALVTGSGQGIGRVIARELAEAGYQVIVNDLRADRAENVAQEIGATGGTAVSLACDITDDDSVRQLVERAHDALGSLDILVNNAGNSGASEQVTDSVPFWDSSPVDWTPWLGTNLFGVISATRAVLPGMIERGFGRIVTVTSEAGRVGEAELAVYSAAKAGAAGLMRAVAQAVGRFGVTANSVSLGAMATEANQAWWAALSEDQQRRVMQRYIVRRLGTPEDAAHAVKFLVDERASWITSQTIPVNGGYSAAL